MVPGEDQPAQPSGPPATRPPLGRLVMQEVLERHLADQSFEVQIRLDKEYTLRFHNELCDAAAIAVPIDGCELWVSPLLQHTEVLQEVAVFFAALQADSNSGMPAKVLLWEVLCLALAKLPWLFSQLWVEVTKSLVTFFPERGWSTNP